jgi:hypothetical protein
MCAHITGFPSLSLDGCSPAAASSGSIAASTGRMATTGEVRQGRRGREGRRDRTAWSLAGWPCKLGLGPSYLPISAT